MAQVEQLKQTISSELRFPLDRLKLVKGGKPLDDDLRAAGLSDGGMATPEILPHMHIHGRCIGALCMPHDRSSQNGLNIVMTRCE